jgi:hypothetical protein
VADFPFYSFDSALLQLALGKNSALDLTTDTLAVYFTNTAPNRASHQKKGDLAEIATGGGYTGAVNLTITSRAIESNNWVIKANSIDWTGSGSGFGPFRYVILYDITSNATDSERKLLGYWGFPSSQTVVADSVVRFGVSSLNGLIRLSLII